MNYFGHAALAIASSGNPEFVLGSMLPDFFSMMGVRCGKVGNPDIDLGIEFHLKTDALFHQTVTFIGLNQNALHNLRQQGVSRGPARACAHIGVEMLIDAILIQNQATLREYLQALSWGSQSRSLLPSQPRELQRTIQRLCAELKERGAAAHGVTGKQLVVRLGRTLRGRARLCPSEQELEAIAKYLSENNHIEKSVHELLVELQPLYENHAHCSNSMRAGV